jgi:NAD(P)-dependent dehydrogenase (short-subunit alcohol dehydrogenase family)
MNDIFSLENKHILVTGASSGIGRQIAITCSELGAKLIITGRNEQKLRETFCKLDNDGHILFLADLNNPKDRNQLIREVENLNGLVNCAGYNELLPISFIENSIYDKITDINYKSPLLLTTELIKEKKMSKNSSIVFISSIAAYKPAVGYVLYSGAKGALTSIAKSLAIELGKKGITVNSISPGLIITDLLETIITPIELDNQKKKYPLKKLGTPIDVANACAFLLSDASKWITGIDLVIDGGVTIT